MYLLDTDHCVFLLRGSPLVFGRLAQRGTAEAHISIISVSELLFGAYWSSRPTENIIEVNSLVGSLAVLPLTHSVADLFARIKVDLLRKGQPLEDPDILIAATAIENDLTLATHNTAHYARISGLRLEDWAV